MSRDLILNTDHLRDDSQDRQIRMMWQFVGWSQNQINDLRFKERGATSRTSPSVYPLTTKRGFMSELNPNHPVTRKVHDYWHALAAMLVVLFLPGHQVVMSLGGNQADGRKAITIKETARGIELEVVSMEEGERLAKKEGGLPV